MDTASTTGFDEGVDLVCAQDSSEVFVCLVSVEALYSVSHIPGQADSAVMPLMWSAGLDSAK